MRSGIALNAVCRNEALNPMRSDSPTWVAVAVIPGTAAIDGTPVPSVLDAPRCGGVDTNGPNGTGDDPPEETHGDSVDLKIASANSAPGTQDSAVTCPEPDIVD